MSTLARNFTIFAWRFPNFAWNLASYFLHFFNSRGLYDKFYGTSCSDWQAFISGHDHRVKMEKSPAERWTKPKLSTIFLHCVPLPAPGPPRTKTTLGLAILMLIKVAKVVFKPVVHEAVVVDFSKVVAVVSKAAAVCIWNIRSLSLTRMRMKKGFTLFTTWNAAALSFWRFHANSCMKSRM